MRLTKLVNAVFEVPDSFIEQFSSQEEMENYVRNCLHKICERGREAKINKVRILNALREQKPERFFERR